MSLKDVKDAVTRATGMTPEPDNPNEFEPMRTVPNLAKIGLVAATGAATAVLLFMALA